MPYEVWLVLGIFANSALRQQGAEVPTCAVSATTTATECTYAFDFDPLASHYKLPSTRESKVHLSWTSQSLESLQDNGEGKNAWYNATVGDDTHLRYMKPNLKTMEAIASRIVEVGLVVEDFDNRQSALESLRTLTQINMLISKLLGAAKPLQTLKHVQIDLSVESVFERGTLLGDGIVG